MFFGTLADIDGHWRTWTDIGGLGRTLADSDGHWRTQTDSCCKGEACLPRSHNKGEPLSPKSCAKKSHNVCPPRSCPFLDSMRQWTCFLGH